MRITKFQNRLLFASGSRGSLIVVLATLLVIPATAINPATGQQQTSEPPASGPPRTEQQLLDEQLAVSGRYQRFERMLSQMADLLAKDDPEKADLLRRAIGKGREQAIGDRLENVVQLMESREFGTAIEKQSEVSESLLVLLQLLQSEDRRSSVEKERERLNQVLTDVRNLITGQRATRAATQNSPSPSNAAPSQQQNLKDADQLIEEIKQHDQEAEAKTQNGDGQRDSQSSDGMPPEQSGQQDKPQDADNQSQPKDSQSKDSQSKDSQSKDSQSKDSQSKDSQSKDSQSKDSQSKDSQSKDSQSKDSQSKDSQSKDSQSKDGQSQQQQQQKTPGGEKIEQARQMMQQALDALKKQDRNKAVENQDESLNNLHKAAAELEEMLRQLREEEKEMLLAALEARFQRMLALQTQIHEGTVELSGTPLEKWPEQYHLRAKDLSQQQTELTSECSQTTGLLREDGSSVSILIAVEDIERDMSSISGLLRENKVTGLTQSMQLDVIEALKELIEATQKEMQEMKSEQRQQQPQQEGPQEKPPLVELKAEIQMLRSLQLRVNRRTQQLDQLLQTAQAGDKSSILTQVQELARRQQRLIQSAKELAEKVDTK